MQLDFLTNMAAFDTGIAVWHSKRRWDAVRPVTAIEHIYGDGDVTAWGGPGQGTVSLPADEWRSYLDVADHPEYPSGSASFCNAHAESARLFLGDDTLNWTVPQPAGSSRVEPGLTPAQDISLHWDTWTEFADDCGMSRFWGGVHFLPSITSGETQGRAIEQLAHDYLQELLAGTAPAR